MEPVAIINEILNEAKTWILGIFLATTVLVIVWHGIKYQKGDEDEKIKAKKNMKRSLEIVAGIFIVIWLAAYLFVKFKVLAS